MEKKVPALRFPEFQESWLLLQLGSLLTFKNGINASREQFGKGYKFINVLDIINNEVITHDKIIGSVDISESIYAKNVVKYGDILFQRSSETREEVGQSNVYLDKTQHATFGGFVIKGTSISPYIPEFLNYLLKTSSARNEITTKSGGSTRYNVGQEVLKDVSITTPSLHEQRKIASFLAAVDDKIQQLGRKKVLLEQSKKGVMQQLFSQKLRFKDVDGNEFPEWEERKVREVFEITRGLVLSMTSVKDHIDEINKYPVYSSQTRNNGLAGYFEKFLFEDCITWTTDGAGAGDVKFRRGKFYCTNVCGVLISKRGYANLFISELLNTISRKHVSYVGNPKLMNNVMAEIVISIPKSVDEQTKIANFLSAIDDKISRVNQQIEYTQKFKSGLLQQMFV